MKVRRQKPSQGTIPQSVTHHENNGPNKRESNEHFLCCSNCQPLRHGNNFWQQHMYFKGYMIVYLRY